MKKRMKKIVALAVTMTCVLTSVGCGTKETDVTTDEVKENVETEVEEEAEVVEETTEATESNSFEGVEVVMGNDMSLDGYNMVWEDNFDGALNEDDWNYELHEPGWVNNELQEYVKSEETVYVEDGKLVIKPVVGTDDDGNTTYLSGRVNTQGKHDFTYGIFEASIKMPAGQGFLPAFWMMPTDENVYGQWPRCGEIDIAEVLGNDTQKTYGTIHYGNPHNESQGTRAITDGDYSQQFHTYAVEWNPGEIIWYVDGYKIHSADDWYSATENLGEVTFPAPFDQPFYMILNLAVGGNWPGNPDATTDFDAASLEVDYVRVYQKEAYDENVEKKVEEVTFREPNADGNYVNNCDFAEAEDLTDAVDWKFLIDKGGAGAAEIKDNMIVITSEKEGTEEYAVQLVQPEMPMKKGTSYKVTFDAWADADRQMKVAVTAPFAGWIRYLPDTAVELTTEKQTFVYEFTMEDADDAKGRLEFNMGSQGSTDTIYITNVSLVETGADAALASGKSILADGNYIYNAKFQEGKAHMGFWDFAENDTVTAEVTNLADGRRLHVKLSEDLSKAYTVGQSELSTAVGDSYILTFDAAGEGAIEVLVNGKKVKFDLTDSMTSYKYEYKGSKKKDVVFNFTKAGDYYLDNVRVEENVLIKNGSFNAGTSGYEVYVDSSASATYVVDSLSEDNAMDFTISSTGDQDWKIQLKQNNVPMIKGESYKLSFDAKSDIERQIRVIIQGQEDKDWAVYSEDLIVDLTSDYQTFSCEFTMEADTDLNAFLSVCLGAVGGTAINEQHRVCVDNITLEQL